jgi:hypothetical protein
LIFRERSFTRLGFRKAPKNARQSAVFIPEMQFQLFQFALPGRGFPGVIVGCPAHIASQGAYFGGQNRPSAE